MPAGITSTDSMFSVRQTPWHGLGAVLDQPPTTIAEAIERSGLGWRVERQPIALDRGDVATANDWWLPRCEEIPGWWANVRQDSRQVLGIVGERYRIVQNSEAFQFVDQLIGSAMHFETAGSLPPRLGPCPATRARRSRRRPRPPLRPAHEQPRRLDRRCRRINADPSRLPEHPQLGARARPPEILDPPHTEKIREHVHQARRVLDLSIHYFKQFKLAGERPNPSRASSTTAAAKRGRWSSSLQRDGLIVSLGCTAARTTLSRVVLVD